MMRARPSVPPPGTKGTIIRMGRSGNAARTTFVVVMLATHANREIKTAFFMLLPDFRRFNAPTGIRATRRTQPAQFRIRHAPANRGAVDAAPPSKIADEHWAPRARR